MWQFLLRSAVWSAVAVGAKKLYDYVASGPVVLSIVRLKKSRIEVEGDELPNTAKIACRDICRESELDSAVIRVWDDGRIDFSDEIPAGAQQRLRNVLVGCRK